VCALPADNELRRIVVQHRCPAVCSSIVTFATVVGYRGLVNMRVARIPSIAAPAAAPPSLAVDPVVPQVTGGMEVEVCGWPDTVAVTGGGGLCTGSLVHPRLVVSAAHCGDGDKTIRFSESSGSGHSVGAQCTTYPDYLGTNDQAHDWAFCVLEEEVLEIPFTPPLYGCELDMIEAGLPVVIAGFGDGGPDGGPGTKRWGDTQIVSTLGNTANIGGMGPSTCQGDSGGSSFVAMPDGSWRALSMTSTGLIGCQGTAGVHALMHPAIPWIEENSGIDITPCHDVDGTWNPTPNCDGFFAGGSEGYGTWSDWCTGTPRSAPSTTCGAAFDAEADDDPPIVTITTPIDGQELEPGTLVSIVIDAQDEGWGVSEVWIEIEGMEQPVRDAYPPYGFADIPFPEGVFEIVAFGSDWAGHVGMSEPVRIGVGEPVPEDPPADDTTTGGDVLDDSSGGGIVSDTTGLGGSTGDVSDESTGPGATGDDGGGEGCGCRSTSSGGPAGMLLVLLALLRRRRQ
jgi:MYXO-CTERM domain-containing protein